jgi:hypothetical protein
VIHLLNIALAVFLALATFIVWLASPSHAMTQEQAMARVIECSQALAGAPLGYSDVLQRARALAGAPLGYCDEAIRIVGGR